MIVESLAYKISIQVDDFLNNKKKVEDEVADLGNKTKRPVREMDAEFGKLSGTVGSLGEASKRSFNTIQMGAAKFLGVALTLEGARRMFTSTTRDLVQMGNMSSFLGMSARSLDGFTRAANAAGVSGGSMSSMLMRLKNAQLWQRTGMGAPDESTIATMQLQGMTGVDIIGQADPGKALVAQAQALRKLGKDQAQVMWERSGGQADMFDLMYNGDINSLQKDYEKRSNATDPAIARAREVNKTLEQLNQTVDGLGQTFVEAFGKDVNEVLKEFGDWIDNHKGDIKDFFKEAGEWAGKFTDSVGGTSNALLILAATWARTPMGALMAAGLYADKKYDDMLGDREKAYGPELTAGGNLRANSPLGKLWNELSGSWDEKEKRKSHYNRRMISEGATNPEAAMDPPKDSGWWDNISSLLGFSPAGASTVTPTLNTNHGDALLNSLMMTESGGNPYAVNKRSGAAGAYQFMPATARDMGLQVGGGVDERLDPHKSRAAASAYMSQLLKRYNGNVKDALQAYNWGMGNMDKFIAGGRVGSMPRETQEYPNKVASYYQRMTSQANMPAGSQSSVDQSQTSTTHIGTVTVNSNPQNVDQLMDSVIEQAKRGQTTVALSGAVNPS